MLFLIFGSSGSGKTAALDALRGRDARLAVHDFDEIGVPGDADIEWRRRSNAAWLERVLGEQAAGRDVMLAGQTPLGELLASPSAPFVDGISACLLDCGDAVRLARMRSRGGWWAEAPLDDFLAWAEWMRGDAADPQHRPDVIQNPAGGEEMRWERWAGWRAGDPRWNAETIDTTAAPVEDVAGLLGAWIERERGLLAAGEHALAAWAARERAHS
jgi:hypothetical protein